MTKEEKIKEAYEKIGFEWAHAKNYVDENGWSNHVIGCPKLLTKKSNSVAFRPSELYGIDKNNGWNIISDVGCPTDETVNYHVLHIDFPEVQEIALMQEIDKRFTHWRRIENPINPIY